MRTDVLVIVLVVFAPCTCVLRLCCGCTVRLSCSLLCPAVLPAVFSLTKARCCCAALPSLALDYVCPLRVLQCRDSGVAAESGSCSSVIWVQAAEQVCCPGGFGLVCATCIAAARGLATCTALCEMVPMWGCPACCSPWWPLLPAFVEVADSACCPAAVGRRLNEPVLAVAAACGPGELLGVHAGAQGVLTWVLIPASRCQPACCS